MKAFKLTLLAILGLTTISVAQVKQIVKAVIQTPTVQCEDCKSRIENQLIHDYGMNTVKADYKKHTVTVSWYTDRTNIENIKTSLANMGYDADDVTADPVAYKRLPKTCQHIAGQKPPVPGKK